MRARRRLLASLLMALLLPGAVVAALAAWARVHAGREHGRALSAVATAAQASLLRERLDLAAARLATVASLWPGGEEPTVLRDALLPEPGFWALRLEGPKGLIEWQDEARLAGEGPGAAAYASALRAGFEGLRAKARAGGGTMVLPVQRPGTVALAVVVGRPDGTFAVGELPPSWLRVPASRGFSTYVVDADGQPLATAGEGAAALLAALPPLRAATSAASAGAFPVPDGEGGSSICSFAAVGRGGLAVIRLDPERALAGSVLAELEPAALLLCGLALLLVLVGLLLAGSLARPAEELERIAGKIAAGELGTKVAQGEGELGVAAAALRRLQRELSARDTELDRQSMRLVESSRRAAAGELALGIAAAARAPLQGVLSYADVGASITGEEDARMLFEELHVQATKAAGVVEELVALADGARTDTAVDLEPAVDEAVRLATPQLSLAGVKLERAPRAPARVKADPAALRQVLVTLLLSAVRRLPGGGILRLVDGATPEGRALVVVEDGGAPLSEEELLRLLEPHKAGASLADAGALGAARELIKRGGGELTAASIAGQGLRLTLELPLLRLATA